MRRARHTAAPDSAPDSPPPDRVFAALSHPKFRRIWGAQLVATIGFWLLTTARAVLVFDITGSAGALGAIYFFTFIPQLVLSPVSGVVADRYDRRRVLIGVQIVRAVGALALGLLAGSGRATMLNISALSVLMGSMQALNGPAGNALIPSLVDRAALSSAVTLNSVMQQASRIVGPLIAAAMIPALGVEWLFYTSTITGLVIIFAWWATPVDPIEPAAAEPVLKAFRGGVRVVRRAPDLWVPIAIVAFISLFGLVYQPLSVALATDTLADGDTDEGATVYGILQAAFGVGAMVGVLVVGRVGRRSPANALMACVVGFSCALVLLGLAPTVALALAAAVLVGGTHFAFLTLSMNLVQHQSTEAYRGRVMSLYSLAFVGLLPISSLVSGAIAEGIGVNATFVAAGLICLGFSLQALRWRHHIRMDGPSAVSRS